MSNDCGSAYTTRAHRLFDVYGRWLLSTWAGIIVLWWIPYMVVDLVYPAPVQAWFRALDWCPGNHGWFCLYIGETLSLFSVHALGLLCLLVADALDLVCFRPSEKDDSEP